MAKNQSTELKLIKVILWIYIILCIVIAGVKYGYASKSTPEVNAICHLGMALLWKLDKNNIYYYMQYSYFKDSKKVKTYCNA